MLVLIAILIAQLASIQPTFAQDTAATQLGEAFLTRFSGSIQRDGETVINPDGTSGSIIDLKTPGQAPRGEHWWDEPQRAPVTATQVGQVFGVAIDDDGNIYLSATSAFGLHRTPDNAQWMAGMWGEGGGPGTIYRLDAAQNYQPSRFADITLDRRANSGAALGNIAYDRWNKQLFVSDLETGMIHRLNTTDGTELGRYDHGTTGRASFTDATSGETASLAAASFDPAGSARVNDCPDGAFANTPSCWNVADFRRRVWGLGVHRNEPSGEVRLYYSIWSSQGFGHPDWATATDDQKNTVWSIALTQDGDFDTASVRREFTLPDFFTQAEDVPAHGASQPVSDIAFPALSGQNVMVLAERGGLRNLGLNSENAFAYPHQARALRYELQEDGTWQPAGRYDVGYYDRHNEGQPFVRANSAGGASFGYGYSESFETDPAKPDQWIWLSGDSLCSPYGMCFDSSANEHNDVSEVHGAQGTDQANTSELLPEVALQPYPDTGYATPAATPDRSAMIDADINVDNTGNAIEEELFRNDATRIGDIEVYQVAAPVGVETAEGLPPAWPVPRTDFEPFPGPWPPEDGGFDLAINKIGPAECQRDEMCAFTIRITNRGPDPFDGPLFVIEDLPVEITDFTVESATWACESNEGSLICEHAPLALAPGASVDLLLNLRIPADWAETEFRNCALIGWPLEDAMSEGRRNRWVEMALRLTGVPEYDPGEVDGIIDAEAEAAIRRFQEDNGLEVTGTVTEELRLVLFGSNGLLEGDLIPANDQDCEQTPIPTMDLAIQKRAIGECRAGGRCDFEVTVSNVGSQTFRHTMAVLDYEAMPGPVVSLTGGWGCNVALPGCISAAEISLSPGDSISFSLGITLAEDFAEDTFRNCAIIGWLPMGFPHGFDTNPGNDRNCADHRLQPPEGPANVAAHDLQITKSARGPDCRPGANCDFMIQIENIGEVDYRGPIVIEDRPTFDGAEESASRVTAITPGFTCVVDGGDIQCSHDDPLTLTAGGPLIHFEVSVAVPEATTATVVENCGAIVLEAMPGLDDRGPGRNSHCISRPIVSEPPAPSDDFELEVRLRTSTLDQTNCRPGGECMFQVLSENHGPRSYVGRLSMITEAKAEGASLPADGLSSSRGGFRALDENTAIYVQVDIPSNDFGIGIIHPLPTLRVAIPEDRSPGEEVELCVTLAWQEMAAPGGDTNPSNDNACATIRLREPAAARSAANLSLSTQALGTCRLGAPCNIGVRINNTGSETFVGQLGIDGRLEPALQLRRVRAMGPGWSCQSTGGGTYQCRHNPITLTPGAQQSFRISAAVPSSLNANAIRHSVKLVWVEGKPDADAKDDVASVTIPLQEASQPATPPVLARCTGGQYWNGKACICRKGYEWNGLRCERTRQVICRGGTVQNGTCVCPEGWRRTLNPRPTGRSIVFRCHPPAPQIRCIRGDVRNNRCYCPKGWTRQRVDTNTYRCDRPRTRIQCENGKVRNNKCVCRNGWRRLRRGPNAFRCVKPQMQKIKCVNGSVRDRKCVCRKGWRLQKTGRNAFRCVKPQMQKIKCVNGSVRGSKCVCRKGWQARRTGRNAYRCVRAQARIRCSGGSVRNGRCICPAGKVARRAGRNAYRCVWRAPD